MTRPLILLAALPFLSLLTSAASPPSEPERLRDAALKSDELAFDIVEGLPPETGQRLAGTDREAAARLWAVRKLKSLGFRNVHVEEARMSGWVRGAETAEIVS